MPLDEDLFFFLDHKAGVIVVSSDNDLLAAIGLEDKQAFTVLMRRHLPAMILLANRIVLNTPEAQEIAQEAFLRVWKHAIDWDPDGPACFSTWLHRVVINLSISRRRQQHPQVGIEEIENIPTDEQNGFDHAATDDQQKMVKKALEKLPERQRAAVALYYYDDLPQKEAAIAMNMTAKGFESLLIRARENLKKHFAQTITPGDLL